VAYKRTHPGPMLGKARQSNAAFELLLKQYDALIRDDPGPDDLPHVKIAPPAARSKSVKPQEIRRAVRKAVQAYVARHSKSLAQS
jgi:hypothetical protein